MIVHNLLRCTALLVAAFMSWTPVRAEVRSRECPYSCRTEGFPREQCRDWREGNNCFVDFAGPERDRGRDVSNTCDPDTSYPQPRIEISQVRPTGNEFGDKVRVHGVIEGVCIKEAGYYEHGSLVDSISVSPSREFRRFEFEVKGREDPARGGEIRAYTVAGDRANYEVAQSPDYRAQPRRDFDDSRNDDRTRGDAGSRLGEAVGDLLGGRDR